MKRRLAIWLCLLALTGAISARGEAAFPAMDAELTADGYLATPGAESVYADEEAGLWRYVSDALRIQITRHIDEESTLCWFETEVFAKDATSIRSYLTAKKGNRYTREHAVDIARENHIVLAINDDYFGTRANNRATAGVVIRNGEILSSKTYKANRGKWPNLETLALFADGSMEAGKSDAYTAEELLARGAWQVLAFGPVLVTGGEVGEHITTSYYYYREPRTAIGMIAPGHYMILTVEGRVSRSKGARLTWLADRLLALGVQEALNLDGGGTVTLIFMGKTLSRSKSQTSEGDAHRSMTGVIGIGTSALVE